VVDFLTGDNYKKRQTGYGYTGFFGLQAKRICGKCGDFDE